MTNALITLSDLFFGPQQSFSEEEQRQIEQAADTQTAREALTKGEEATDWPSAWRHIQSELPRLFDVPLLDILLAGWEKYRLVTQYANAGAHPTGERTTLELEKRSLTSIHNPRVELLLNDKLRATLTFTIKLQLQFKVLKLTLGAGRIWSIETGQCEGTGSVLMRNHTILQRTFSKVNLPGRIDIPGGIRIPTPELPHQWGESGNAFLP